MGSDNGDQRNSGKNNGRNPRGRKQRPMSSRRRPGRPSIEALEQRTLLDGGGLTGPPPSKALNSNVAHVKNAPLANTGQNLIGLYMEYQQYLQSGSHQPFQSSYASMIRIKSNFVGVDALGYGDFSTYLTNLKNLGMQVVATDSNYK